MPFKVVVADLINAYGENKEHDTRQLENIGFVVESLTGEELDESMRLAENHLELSLHDVSALILCLSRGYSLLARSPQLLTAARDISVSGERAVVVHGTLWLLDQLATHGRLSPWEAAEAVRTILARGRDLDRGACERFIGKWDKRSH